MDEGTWCERYTDLTVESPTLIEGLPGHGMVASIAVDRITDQLGLDHYGSVHSEHLPRVTTFEDGRVRDLVRVYAGDEAELLTLQSDVPVPTAAFDALVECILSDLVESFGRGVFLAGVPARDEDDHGTVSAIATTDALEADLRAADIELAEGAGIVGGVTGALAQACYHAEVPAAILIVQANPYFPDPVAAKALIEEALEPLVEFEIETAELEEQAAEIREGKQQIAQQLKQQQEEGAAQPQGRSMFQ
jgi:uncharacterized protein